MLVTRARVMEPVASTPQPVRAKRSGDDGAAGVVTPQSHPKKARRAPIMGTLPRPRALQPLLHSHRQSSTAAATHAGNALIAARRTRTDC